ncbi:MAG: GNAT family N-acetyltransferase [Chloroflexota bacterium]|nr:MAG: GNAT family N-acetyltransferase [Chloroflexota bacterium]
MISNRESALKLVRQILAADFACDESDFDKEGIAFSVAKELEGARRFPLPEKFLAVVTMGRGVVVSCSADRLHWARTNLKGRSPEALFYALAIARMEKYVGRDRQTMFGPELKYICTQDSLQLYRLDGDIAVNLVQEERIKRLYENNLFPNALGRHYDPQRPRLLGCSARHDGVTVGLAAASADSDSMWQVGIDILPGYRDRGIGKALVSQLTEALFKMEKLPYYSTGISNVASRRTAIAVGYRPAWVEIFSKERSEVYLREQRPG